MRPYRLTKRPCAAILVTFAITGIGYAATPAIVVSDAWSRPANGTAVVYATVRNYAERPDRLVGAASPAATSVTLHETSESKTAQGSASMDGMPMTGAMTSMASLSSIPVPAHGSTRLAPGGYHLMLELRHGTVAGQTIPLRLHFARAGWVATDARVRTEP